MSVLGEGMCMRLCVWVCIYIVHTYAVREIVQKWITNFLRPNCWLCFMVFDPIRLCSGDCIVLFLKIEKIFNYF